MTDPILSSARFLATQLEYARHQPWAGEFLADVDACARVVRALARGPREQQFLGPCGAPLISITPEVATANGIHPDNAARGLAPCDGDVYAPRDAHTGTCRTCGARYNTADRQAWLDGEVRQHAFTARDIADAHGINVKTIRTWATRVRPDTGRPVLASYWRTEGGIVAEWVDPPEGEKRERLHYVGDVLDLAAADAARRETERATRERRAASRAEDERLSA